LNNQGFTRAGLIPPGELKKKALRKASMPSTGSIIIAFFPIERDQQGNIAPFAARNYYREMINRMKDALKQAGPPYSDLSKRDVYLFSNSSLPEKKLAEAGGLGFIGRNTLLIEKTYGSRGLLAGMILPLELEVSPPSKESISPGCGTCRACEESCPGSALRDFSLNREKCLQHWTSSEGIIPDRLKKVWGNRIYGCTVCQDVCPWNRKVPRGNSISRGVINPQPELSFYLTQPEPVVKEYFRGTAMGMKWFKGNSMIRNAVLSASSTEEKGIIEKVENHTDSEDAGIRDAARWTLETIRRGRGH